MDREAKNKYSKEWDRKNPIRRAEIYVRYWQRRVERLKAATEEKTEAAGQTPKSDT